MGIVGQQQQLAYPPAHTEGPDTVSAARKVPMGFCLFLVSANRVALVLMRSCWSVCRSCGGLWTTTGM